jgi:hypothetical protein
VENLFYRDGLTAEAIAAGKGFLGLVSLLNGQQLTSQTTSPNRDQLIDPTPGRNQLIDPTPGRNQLIDPTPGRNQLIAEIPNRDQHVPQRRERPNAQSVPVGIHSQFPAQVVPESALIRKAWLILFLSYSFDKLLGPF